MTTLADALRQTGYSQDGELAVPTPVEPTMTSILQKHIATLPQQLATNQAALDNAIGSWNKTDFGTGLPNPNYRPEAINELTQLMPNIGALTAWHGTPHQIKGAFDISKVGTGEGAQAYGHGMYFAESPNVAETYRHAGEVVKYIPTMEKFTNGPNYFMDEAGNYMKVRDYVKNDIPVKVPKEEYLQKFNEVKAIQETQKPGNLYKVDIPDEHIPNMMDYYKPLSEQPQAVKDVAMQYANGLKNQIGFKGVKSIWDLDGGDLYGVMQRYQLNDAGKLVKKNVDAKDVSDKLLNAGIPGIKYLDQGSLQQTDSYLAKHGGTKNFVVFEPSTVKILEENGKPLSRKEILEKELKKVVE